MQTQSVGPAFWFCHVVDSKPFGSQSSYVLCLVAQLYLTLQPNDCSLPGSSVHGIFQARILEWLPYFPPGIFPNQESNPGLLQCRQILHCMSCQESPRIVDWVAYPFSRGSSQPGMELESPTLQMDSLPDELPGKPKVVILLSITSLVIKFPP